MWKKVSFFIFFDNQELENLGFLIVSHAFFAGFSIFSKARDTDNITFSLVFKVFEGWVLEYVRFPLVDFDAFGSWEVENVEKSVFCIQRPPNTGAPIYHQVLGVHEQFMRKS